MRPSDAKRSNTAMSSGTGGASTDVTHAAQVAKRVRWVRKFLGMTQVQFAKALGARQQAVNGWENGNPKYSIGLGYAIVLCTKFELSLDFIYLGKKGNLPLRIEKAYDDDH